MHTDLPCKPNLQVIIESFRDWGRDCWCDPGKENTCGKRFDWQLGTLPCGYDHKYTYSHIGYNLKATDMQAALGASQIAKLPEFIERRKENFRHLRGALEPHQDRAPQRVDERSKGPVERVLIIVHHLANYLISIGPLSTPNATQ